MKRDSLLSLTNYNSTLHTWGGNVQQERRGKTCKLISRCCLPQISWVTDTGMNPVRPPVLTDDLTSFFSEKREVKGLFSFPVPHWCLQIYPLQHLLLLFCSGFGTRRSLFFSLVLPLLFTCIKKCFFFFNRGKIT